MSLVWNVKNFDCNAQMIRDCNILKNREDFIKKLKKSCASKKDFSEALEREFRWQYWSRSEYELIIEVLYNRVLLMPWSGCREPMRATIDVTDDKAFNWYEFAKCHIDRQLYNDKAKIDVWHQLSWRWKDFVDYCWYTRLPYERYNKKFYKEA